jgi:hypothetical protein
MVKVTEQAIIERINKKLDSQGSAQCLVKAQSEDEEHRFGKYRLEELNMEGPMPGWRDPGVYVPSDLVRGDVDLEEFARESGELDPSEEITYGNIVEP